MKAQQTLWQLRYEWPFAGVLLAFLTSLTIGGFGRRKSIGGVIWTVGLGVFALMSLLTVPADLARARRAGSS